MSFGREQFLKFLALYLHCCYDTKLNINIEISLEVMPIVIQSLTIYFAVSCNATNITYLMKKE